MRVEKTRREGQRPNISWPLHNVKFETFSSSCVVYWLRFSLPRGLDFLIMMTSQILHSRKINEKSLLIFPSAVGWRDIVAPADSQRNSSAFQIYISKHTVHYMTLNWTLCVELKYKGVVCLLPSHVLVVTWWCQPSIFLCVSACVFTFSSIWDAGGWRNGPPLFWDYFLKRNNSEMGLWYRKSVIVKLKPCVDKGT